jgi:hypothetical protein
MCDAKFFFLHLSSSSHYPFAHYFFVLFFLSHPHHPFQDPFTVAVVFEDSAAVLGVLFASAGIVATHLTGHHIYDGIASLCISVLLGTVSLKMVQLNHAFLLGRVRKSYGVWLCIFFSFSSLLTV